MKKINFLKYGFFAGLTILSVSCTNLDEEIIEGDTVPAGSSLSATQVVATLESAYNGLRDFQTQGQQYGMGELPTDIMAGPTRGGDWDDNAKWRQLHTLTWGSDNPEIKNAYVSLLSNVYKCNQIVESTNATPAQLAEARFLRAFYYYHVVDLFGQAPYRAAGTSLQDDAKVWTSAEATDFIIAELEAVVTTLPARVALTAPSTANKDAAHFLLAKIYLNKAVFKDTDRVSPFTFDPADMTKVVAHVDAMTTTLATDYWSNFIPANSETSNELAFVSKNIQAGDGGGMQYQWRMGQHYNQTPGGWNGFVILTDFYNSFAPTDRRIKNNDASIITAFGNPAGIEVGQQYAPGGTTPLNDRNGAPLNFVPITNLITSGATLETAGYRPMKYVPDVVNIEKPNNDYVFFRYADALLMKAEAIKRGGTGSLGTIATDLAGRTGVTTPIDLSTEAGILKARGNELWLEGWRRNDLIRFGKFLEPNALKPTVSDAKYLLFPIPADGLLNPNIKQNPGY